VYSATNANCYTLTNPLTGSISTAAAPTTTVSVVSGNNASEPSTNGTFQITLSSPAPSGGVTVVYSLSGSASIPADYTDPANGSILIPEGSSSATITLPVTDDDEYEEVENVSITLTSATSPFSISTGTASITITDNDVAYVNFTGDYSQNFNSLASSGTSASTPLGWMFSETGTSNNLLYTAGNGSGTAGDTYSFGSTGSSDRAFGGLRSGSLIPTIGARIKNNTGENISALTISYIGEQWRLGATGRADRINFQYSLDATSLSSGTWTHFDPLDFSSPVTSGTVGVLDGNAAQNRKSVTETIRSISLPTGSFIWIRWTDPDATGSDDGLAIDDITIRATAKFPCTSPSAPATNLTFNSITDKSINGSFTSANPSPDEYLVVMTSNNNLTSDPIDGQNYSIGANVGGGTVISKGSTTTFTATGLNGGTSYNFFIYSVNSNCTEGPKYLTADGFILTGNATTIVSLPPCNAPSSQPTNLQFASVTTNSIQGSFTGNNANEFLIVRSTSSVLSQNPADGQVYTTGSIIGNGTVIQRSSSTTFTTSSLSPNTTYYFFVFSLNSVNCKNGPAYNVTEPLNANVTTLPLPVCVTPEAAPTNLVLYPSFSSINGAFTQVTSADNYLVIKSSSSTLTSTPQNNTTYNLGAAIGGGIVIANGSSTSFTANELQSSGTYYFYVFASNANCTGGVKYFPTPLTGTASTTAAPAYNVYFGNLHAHSDYSDGNKDRPGYTPADDYAYAKDAECMDFLGISEHNHFSSPNNPGNQIANYRLGLAQADAFNSSNSNFLALYGMEWGVISGGGHVLVYGDGMNELFGWESGSGAWGPTNNYDVFVPKSTYTGTNGLFKAINDRADKNTFAILAHPNNSDFNNLSNIPYDAAADAAIAGTAVASGPAFSTDTTYSNPSAMSDLWYYQKMLSKGYRLGPTIDHDNHNTTFGKTSRGRLAILAPVLTRTELFKAIRQMRYYATEDCDTKVDFSLNNKMMGSELEENNLPSISVNITDFTTSYATAKIRLMYGIVGSGSYPVAVDSAYGTSFSFINNSQPVNSTAYYYIEIYNGATITIVTSPIWFKRTCSNTTTSETQVSCNSYTWNGTTYTASGDYTYQSANADGCTNTATLHLTINQKPEVSLNAGGPTTFCPGESVKLTATEAVRYLWSNADTTRSITVNKTGNYSVTITDANGCSNTSEATTVTVSDNEAPIITSNGNKNASTDEGTCGAVVAVSASATDNCSVGTPTGVRSDGLAITAAYPVGTTTITWDVTDTNGNAALPVTQTVTVLDNVKPVITSNGNKTVNNDAGTCGAAVTVSATATDNCIVGTPTGVRSDGFALTAAYPVGTTTITWNVTDAHGNAALPVTQTVTVLDDVKPVITTNGNKSISNDAGTCGAAVTVSATATDNCIVGTPTGVRSDGIAITAAYPVGTTTITWNVTDANGNAALPVTQTVTVTDNVKPVITSNGNKTVNNDAGTCGAAVTVSASATDNCIVGIPTGVRSDSLSLTAAYPVGTTTITWNVTDANGNAALPVTQTVTVSDNIKPVIATNGNKSISNDAGTCGAAVTVSASATDNCFVGAPTGVRSDGLVLTAAYPVGTTTITWNVTDANGNAALAVTQTVTVTDNQNPTITAPGNISINADNGTCSATNVTLGIPTTADNCGVASVTNNAPASYPVGTTTVTWTVTDIHGRTATATQTVIVRDNQAPNITTLTVPVQCFNTSGTYTIDPLTSSDNCGIRSTTFTINGVTARSGNSANASGTFNPGTSTINWTVTDVNGNTSTSATTVVIDKVEVSVEDVYASGVTPSNGQPNTIYVGYGGSSLTFNSVTTSSVANNQFTYRWTIGSPSGTLVGTGSSVTVSPTATTTYYLTIKDLNNCKTVTNVSKQVTVVNIVCGSGKITVCVPQKNGSTLTSCVSSAQSSISKLPAGWYLGACKAAAYVTAITSGNNTSISSAPNVITTEVNKDFNVIVSPNPSSTYFRIVVQSKSTEAITIRLLDVSGRVLSTNNKVQRNETTAIGKNLIGGTYVAEVIQGLNRKKLILIKTN
jgi:uncharacterized membrane protein YccF (DUF307 family)